MPSLHHYSCHSIDPVDAISLNIIAIISLTQELEWYNCKAQGLIRFLGKGWVASVVVGGRIGCQRLAVVGGVGWQ